MIETNLDVPADPPAACLALQQHQIRLQHPPLAYHRVESFDHLDLTLEDPGVPERTRRVVQGILSRSIPSSGEPLSKKGKCFVAGRLAEDNHTPMCTSSRLELSSPFGVLRRLVKQRSVAWPLSPSTGTVVRFACR